MRPFALTIFIAGLWVCAARLAHSASDTIDVSAVRAGMKGYGLTVFRGTKPERFDVEVIDVLHDFQPQQDLILIRTPHPILDKAFAVAGMSGSPVYLDGKLAGAYAYGWMYGKEPIAGVTPIANMMAELTRPVDPQIWRAIGAAPQALQGSATKPTQPRASLPPRRAEGVARLAGLPPSLGMSDGSAFDPLREYARLHPQPRELSDDGSLRPAVTPIMYSGLSGNVARILDDELGRFGLMGLQAGASGGKRKAGDVPSQARFEDGGSIGVEMMRGDISMTGVGTVTRVVGNRLVAFGHPMINAGQPGLPTCTSRVLHVMANERRSFKLAEAETSLGTMVQDRQAAIVVDTTVKADTIPLQLRIHGAPAGQRDVWSMEVASHRMLTPLLIFTGLGSALSASVVDQTDVSFRARSRVQVQGRGVIETFDAGYSGAGAASPLALGQLRLFPVVDAAFGNPFENAHIERVEVDLELNFARDVWTIVDALLPSSEVDPGRDASVYLTLKPFGGNEQVRKLSVPIPKTAAGQKIELIFEPGNRVQVERPEPKDLAQVFANARLGYPATSLVISTKLPNQGLSLRGHVVRGLPGSALDSLQLGADAARPVPFATVTRAEIPLGHLVDGSARLSLDVRPEPLR